MGIPKKKGFSIATQSAEQRLYPQAKCFDGFEEIKSYYNQIAEFYFMLINTDPSGLSATGNDSGWRYYEILTQGKKKSGIEAQYPLPQEFDGCPRDFRRAAIRAAIGAYESWQTRYEKWKNRPKRHKHHRPPVQPRKFNFSPVYCGNMFWDDSGLDIMLKVRVKSQWMSLKFHYKGQPVGKDWIKSSPSIVLKNGHAYITFCIQRYVPATGGIAKITKQDTFRILATDLDLDDHAAIVSILEIDGCTIREIARHFIKQPEGVASRKRDLGRIALKMNATGIIHKGFCHKQWEKIRNREKAMGYDVASQILNLAVGYGCQVIAFEHLANLKPCRGKYSRRSNQKRAYWLKSKIYNNVKHAAFARHGILTTRVNPKNTSKLDPWGNPVNRQNHIPEKVVAGEEVYETGATWVKTASGYTAHSGVNASRNVGIKALLRHRKDLEFLVDSGEAFAR
ncbi:MAG: hypothetical protein AAF378_00175 [Cyanobacteria bacterium P01_A01_bin.84]